MTTERDRAILNNIFNPFLPLGDIYFEEKLPVEEEEITTTSEEAKKLETEGVKACEDGNISKAMELLNLAIEIDPLNASAYNNRAQAYRLKGDIIEAMLDLNKSLELSQGLGRSAHQAFCQRGLIHRRNEDTDAARKDFQAAAKLGSAFAKGQLVELNPYAALCNQMLSQVLGKI